MENLFYYNDILTAEIDLGFKRSLYKKIDWTQRMIAISGARGVGKTTLMLQRQKETIGLGNHSLYASMDNPYFYNQSLFNLADEFYTMGGRFLLLDEVHKYAHWSRELKAIYDAFPRLQVIFSASSALDIYRGEADLSRRVFSYTLPGLSFREFLAFHKKWKFPIYEIDHILFHHREIANTLTTTQSTNLLQFFKEYLRSGYYPFSISQRKKEYLLQLSQVINTVLDTDMAYTDGYTPATALKLKKLLAVLAESVPFQPNVAELARKLHISRDSIYHYLKQLEKAVLVLPLHAQGKGVSLLQKPEKLYLENTNLAYALQSMPNVGNIRETFLLNQLVNAKQKVSYPKKGDFVVDNHVFEVEGRNKNRKQLTGVDNGYIVSDDILTGAGNKIPLWLFGLLY